VELQTELQFDPPKPRDQAELSVARATLTENLGAVRAARAARWAMRFKRAAAEDYLQQLSGLGAEVAFPESGEKYRYFTVLPERSESSLREISQESRIYFIDDSPESSEEIGRLLGVSSTRFMCVFLPPPLEEKMLKMERGYRGAGEDEVARTVFEVTSRDGGHDVSVVSQSAKSAAPKSAAGR
jgi:hypothetical protein